MNALYLILFIVLVSIIIFVSIVLAYLIDYFEKYSKFSAAFLSGIVFSLISSFPEFITSVLSSFDIGSKHDTIFSNLLGGNIFILFSLAIVTLIFIKNFNKNKITIPNIINICALLLCYALISYALFAPSSWQVVFGGFNLMSLLIMVIYVAMFVYTTFFERKEDTSNKVVVLPKWLSNINIKFATMIFAGLSIGVIGTSVAITFVDEQLIRWLFGASNSDGFGASILLGIPTSLPELVSIILLCKIKNYDASFQTILGSALFSIFSFSICDALTTHINGFSIYDWNSNIPLGQSEQFIVIINSFALVLVFGIWLIFCKIQKGQKIYVGICSGINVLIYITYIILGFSAMSKGGNYLDLFIPINCYQQDIPNLMHQTCYHNSFFLHQAFWNQNSYKNLLH